MSSSPGPDQFFPTSADSSTVGRPPLPPATQPPVRLVSDVSVYFLQHEFIKYIFDTRCNSVPQPPVASSAGCQSASKSEPSLTGDADFSTALLEEAGFNLGLRLHERLILPKNRIWDSRECVKFICKDLWCFLFQKQADRLQTNRKGGFVILDNNLPPLRYVTAPQSADSTEVTSVAVPLRPNNHHSPAAHLVYVCGIIRGALTNSGFGCTVQAQCLAPPSCKSTSTTAHRMPPYYSDSGTRLYSPLNCLVSSKRYIYTQRIPSKIVR